MNKQLGYPAVILSRPDNSYRKVAEYVSEMKAGDILQVEADSNRAHDLAEKLHEEFPHNIFTWETFTANCINWAYIYIKTKKKSEIL